MKICYIPRNFHDGPLLMISRANDIIDTYAEQGYQLTLRQLYYQFVSRDFIPNTIRSYENLGSIINDGRLAGLIDWDAIEDRTRNLSALSVWGGPGQIVQACAEQYREDLWRDQDHYIEVWIEKEALAGVFERVCVKNRVPFFSCRGYVSQSEMWGAAQRLVAKVKRGKQVQILHFGDHDPSGIDMTRDIEDRLTMFMRHEGADDSLIVQRLALNMDQIQKYKPPPNPAKKTDSRFRSYKEEFGENCWELDALEPTVLAAIVDKAVAQYRDKNLWDQNTQEENRGRESLEVVADKMNRRKR